MSLCHLYLSKCAAGPDTLAPKDCTVGQVACLKVVLCSLWECLLPGTAVLVLFAVPCTARPLAGKTSHLLVHKAS